MQHTHEHRLLKISGVASYVGCAESTIWRWVEDGVFPQPVRLGNVTRWDSRDVEAHLEKMKRSL